MSDDIPPAMRRGRPPIPPEQRWYTVRQIASLLHLRPLTAWRLVRPHRSKCHLARNGPHPRLVLWVPATVVRALSRERAAVRSCS